MRLFATVTAKRVEGDRHLVDLVIHTESHPRGERTSEGTATVELPSREAGNVVWTAPVEEAEVERRAGRAARGRGRRACCPRRSARGCSPTSGPTW